MKSMLRAVSAAVVLATVGFSAPATYAATTTTFADFDATPSQVLQARPKSWSDPAFGNKGWTHHSAWGAFHANKGQIVTIKAVAADADFHPGLTVWLRPKQDTAPNNYVPDHFYTQKANQIVLGATDESTGTVLGDIFMINTRAAYDGDGIGKVLRNAGVRYDGVSGQVEMSFVAREGDYVFVLGGIKPGPGITVTNVKYDVQVDVTVANP